MIVLSETLSHQLQASRTSLVLSHYYIYHYLQNHIGCKSAFHCLRTSILIHTAHEWGLHLIQVEVEIQLIQ